MFDILFGNDNFHSAASKKLSPYNARPLHTGSVDRYSVDWEHCPVDNIYCKLFRTALGIISFLDGHTLIQLWD